MLRTESKTYSTKDSRVVTHRSTNLAIRSLTMGERTGSRIFFNLWPYVTDLSFVISHNEQLRITKSAKSFHV
ncbi:hypothetical protein BJ508DRAFT_344023 [Ascobolus immersus RN42]|uniref:Uncharacterized protein n=1 Tax=Ascobolus immersus RN42 TaxID=1160509 RepID=A0A3N4HBI5_ASCIM|nr:hypothetical protein BJ508DRAFT_344023 [Ascobolus immersus RN42]